MSKVSTDLGKDNIGKLLFQLATPAIIAQLVNLLYNIVDRIFIGRMQYGDIAMAGVGIASPIILIISAFSSLIGMGGAPLVAIKMGEKDNRGAEKIMSNAFSCLIILSIILTILFQIFKEPMLWKFGASEATIKYSIDYLGIYLIGTIFVQIALGMNSFINTQGFARIGMTTVMIGAIINIILDPILIYGFNMGVKGAATATVISQSVSAVWVLKFLFGKKSILKIRREFIIPKLKIMLPVLGLGIAPFIMQSTESIVLVTLNSRLQMFGGDLAVGAMTIMSSIMQIITMPATGLSQGSQPIISYNFGAKQIDRVKKTFKLCISLCFSYTTFMWIMLMIVPKLFVKVFNNDPALLGIASWSIKVYFAGIFMFGIQMACQQTFLALGQAKISLFLALLRKIFLLVPLVFILPNFIDNKLFATLLSEPIADVVAAATTAICFVIFYKKTLMNIEKEFNNEKNNVIN
ncbi:MATE family efflux transporter [Romboutsia weinsteinii]|uniref:Multidrug export protein MepA n=1 Tax=Romboutsia weinsteinii TaxID=2020949 RepID=A0A371J3H1_9FIRM|nr:MATE family efflux transporter [Romboutsia weinsteinii]RDY27217.1 MATE family efflux transporter [Romboutsia weinsteinii]